MSTIGAGGTILQLHLLHSNPGNAMNRIAFVIGLSLFTLLVSSSQTLPDSTGGRSQKRIRHARLDEDGDGIREKDGRGERKMKRQMDQFIDRNADGICDMREAGLGFKRRMGVGMKQSGNTGKRKGQ